MKIEMPRATKSSAKVATKSAKSSTTTTSKKAAAESPKTRAKSPSSSSKNSSSKSTAKKAVANKAKTAAKAKTAVRAPASGASAGAGDSAGAGAGEMDLDQILRNMSPELDSEVYVFVNVSVALNPKDENQVRTALNTLLDLPLLLRKVNIHPMLTFTGENSSTESQMSLIVRSLDIPGLRGVIDSMYEAVESSEISLTTGAADEDDSKIPRFQRIVLKVHSSLESVGLTATVSNLLAQNNISANIVAAFWGDHVFVPVAKAKKTLKLLQGIKKK